MTQILFHVQVSDRLRYACRLLRKAARQGACVAVTAPEPALQRFDKLLWSFEPMEFIPHVFMRQGERLPPRLQSTPIWLVADPVQAIQCPVLVNLGDEAAQDIDRFERLIEIVADGELDREAGRQRWRQYVAAGHAPQRHDAAS